MAFRFKLILAFLLVNVMTLAFFYGWTTRHLETFLIENATAQLEEELSILSQICSVADPELDVLVDSLASEGIFRITVTDKSGTVLADSAFSGQALLDMENHAERPEIRAALSEGVGRSLRYSKMTSQSLLYVAVPLPSRDGIIRIAKRPADIEALSGQLRRTLAVGVLILLLAGGAAVWGIAFRMTRSIELLADAARSITAGDFVRYIGVNSSDEVGGLARRMETMSGQLQKQVRLLQSEKNHLTAVLNGMSEAVLVTDLSGHIVTANPSFLTLFRLSEEPRQRTLIEVIRNVDLVGRLDAVLKGRVGEPLEFGVEGKTLIARFAPIGDLAEIGGAVIVIHDITELRRLEDLRKELISNLSHELKTPLTSIKGFAETLIEEKELNVQHRDFIARIYQNSNQLSEMIDEVFSLASLETGEPRIEFRSVDFVSLMADLEKTFSRRLEEKRLVFRYQNHSSSATFSASEQHIRRVFENLVENAIHYTEAGGIEIDLYEEGEEFRFAVCDTGKGIPQEDLVRIFERFYRVDKDRSRKTGGPGIGLAVVKHIVKLHGGRVWAESRLERGTSIHFTLAGRNALSE